MIIDAHCHLPVEGDSFIDKKKRLLLEMEKYKIDYAVVIADNVESSIGRAEDLLEAFEGEDRLFVVAAPNVLVANQVLELEKMKGFLMDERVVGLKIFCGHDAIYINDSVFDKYYSWCEKNGKLVIFHTGANSGNGKVAKYNDPKYIVEVLNKYPKLRVVVAHFFWPEVKYCWKLLKGFDNVFFDLSAMADKEVEELTGKEIIKKLWSEIVANNPKKLVYGSDYNCCRMEKHLELVKSLGLDKEVEEFLWWKNAKNVFNLSI